jgi:hypothetical protein
VAHLEYGNAGANRSPALRVVANGGVPHGALRVSTQGTGLIAPQSESAIAKITAVAETAREIRCVRAEARWNLKGDCGGR